ncbi:MAG TPA: phosphodiesterase, partial [Anaerolineae bacterium]|nr:phosphodiesterase [Anaerolineae bacterium]
VDLAPTIFYMMGVPVPQHMDGRILQEIVQPDFQPVQSGRPATAWESPSGSQEGELSEEDKQILTDRLRSLGYVG